MADLMASREPDIDKTFQNIGKTMVSSMSATNGSPMASLQWLGWRSPVQPPANARVRRPDAPRVYPVFLGPTLREINPAGPSSRQLLTWRRHENTRPVIK